MGAALAKAEQTDGPAAAMQLPDGTMITGKSSKLLGAASAMLLNAVKYLAGIPDDVLLISPEVLEPIADLKTRVFGNRNPRLHTDETLIALSICAASDVRAKAAHAAIGALRGAEVHTTTVLSAVDEKTLRRLGVRVTCEPVYQKKTTYHT